MSAQAVKSVDVGPGDIGPGSREHKYGCKCRCCRAYDRITSELEKWGDDNGTEAQLDFCTGVLNLAMIMLRPDQLAWLRKKVVEDMREERRGRS